MKKIFRLALAFFAFALVAPGLFAYVVKLKDGSLIFARSPYTVKGKRAIITLENGTVTQIDADKIDVPGTVKYNKENFGNVVALDTPQEKIFQLPTPVPQSKAALQDLVRKRGLDRPTPNTSAPPPDAPPGSSEAWQADPIVRAAFAHIFEGTGLTQYRVTSNRGKTRVIATANSEQSVFNTLSATARAIVDAADRGRAVPVELVLTTGSGEPAGTFEISPAQAKVLVDRGVTVQDFFVKNVIF